MEYSSGRTLRQILDERKVLPPVEALPIFDQVLQAMEPAGRESVRHCPIRPSNIVIGNDGRVELRALSVTEFASCSSDTLDPLPETPPYLSPEHVSGQAVDIRSEIFSVGTVLYEVLTGERPFTAENNAALIHQILEAEPIPPRVLNINVPDVLDDLIKKALAKDPADRFQTPTEMLTALRAVAQSLNVVTGGRNGATVSPEALLPEEAPSVGKEDRGRAGAPQPSGKTVTVPWSLHKDAPPPRSRTEAVAGSREIAWQTEPREVALKEHGAVPSPLPEMLSGERSQPRRLRPAARALVSLAVFLTVLVAGGMLLWRLLAPPSEQASSLSAAAPGLSTLNGQNTGAESDLRRSVDSLVDRAGMLWETDPDTARKLLEQAVSLDPNHFDATFQLARFLTFKKDFPAAIQHYQNALRINDQVPEVFFNLGYIYFQQGALDQAIENYEACQALSPPYLDEVLTNLAVCRWQKNEQAQARVLLQQALDYNPNNELARGYLNMLEKAVGTQK